MPAAASAREGVAEAPRPSRGRARSGPSGASPLGADRPEAPTRSPRARRALRRRSEIAAWHGVRHQFGNGSEEGDLAARESVTPSAEPSDLVEPLRRPDDGSAPRRGAGDEVAHAPRALGIEIVCRLVDEQDRRVGEQRARDRQPLLHPVRVEADARLGGVGEADLLEQLAGPPRRRRARRSRAAARRRRGSRGPRCGGRTSGRRRDESDQAAERARVVASAPEDPDDPPFGTSSPARMRRSVVLPAPFGPSRAWIDPGATSSDTESSTTFSSNWWTRDSTRIAGCSVGRDGFVRSRARSSSGARTAAMQP